MGGIYTNKIYREKKNKNFTKIPNIILRDKDISLKAKGFLCLMISLPKIWKHNIKGFSAICKDGTKSIRTVIGELEECGYLERKRVRNEKGCLTDTKYILLLNNEPDNSSKDSEKEDDFTLTANFHLRDKELSLKAKGLFTLILSFPDEWDFSVKGLRSLCKEGTDSINSALKELEAKKYVVRRRKRTADGKFLGSEYTVYENPSKADSQDKEQCDLPVLENRILDNRILDNQILDNRILENQPQSNTNILNTNILNTKESNTESINLSENKDISRSNDDDLSACMDLIKKNISYDDLCICCKENIDKIDNIVNLICEIIVFNQEPIKINHNLLPAENVKERFLNLNRNDIEHAVNTLIKNASEIRNVRNYTISVLYNTKTTNSLHITNTNSEKQNDSFTQVSDYNYSTACSNISVKKNSFNSYEQREYDDDEFDAIIRRKLAQSCG